MGLDVYLLGEKEQVEKVCHCCNRSYIDEERPEFFSDGVTHNLIAMAEAAGIYKHLWRPAEVGITKASELVEPLREGLRLLESDPARFKQFNPPNGWGNYDVLRGFVRQYLEACREYPDAEVYACR